MRHSLVATVCATALLFAGAPLALAQDTAAPAAQDPAINAPSADALKREDLHREMLRNEKIRAAESPAFRSDGSQGTALGGSAIAGGLSAQQLIGANVLNGAGHEIGKIEDLLIDADSQVNLAIVEVGGFLGLGSKHVAVSIAELKRGEDRRAFVTTMTKDELAVLPQYTLESGAWVRGAR